MIIISIETRDGKQGPYKGALHPNGTQIMNMIWTSKVAMAAILLASMMCYEQRCTFSPFHRHSATRRLHAKR